MLREQELSVNLWSKISAAGIDYNTTTLGVRSRMLTNQMTAALFVLTFLLLLAMTVLFPANVIMRGWLTALVVFLGGGLFLNGKGTFVFSQFLLSTGLPLFLLFSTIHSKLHHPWLIHEGSYYNPRYFLIGLSFIPLVVFDLRQRGPLAISVFLNVLLLVLYNTIHRWMGAAPDQIGLDVIDLSFVSIASSSAGIAIVLGMVFLKRANYRYERRIEELLETTRQQNEELNASIRYARRLQEAVLSPISPDETGPDLRVFTRPRDQLSGDFFFFYPNGGDPYISVVDCTGHGVPGAFVSLMANKALHKAVRTKGDAGPAAILIDLQERFIREFQSQGAHYVHDGMDLMLCRIHPQMRTITAAGARGIGYLVRRNELVVLDADRRSIGDGDLRPFSTFTYVYEPGDLLVLTSDGFQDQFGGENEKKIGKKRLRSMLEDVRGKSAEDAQRYLKTCLLTWQGDTEQTDDVCVAVYRLS